MRMGAWPFIPTHSNSFQSMNPSLQLHLKAAGALLLGLLLLPARLALAQTAPPNDNFINGIRILGTNITVLGTNDYASKELGEPNHAGNAGGKSVWWTWQTASAAYVTLSTRGSTNNSYGGPLDTVLAVYTGTTVSALTEVASNDEDPATYYTSRLSFKADPGVTYHIAVDGYTYDFPTNADSGTIVLSLSLSAPSTNDSFANAISLNGTNLTATGNNDAASKEPGEPNHAGNPGGKSVWWRWQAPAAGFVTLSTQGSISSLGLGGSAMYALLAVYVGDSVSNLVCVDQSMGDPANLTFHANAGKTYRIAVDGYSSGTASTADSGNIQLSLKLASSLPLALAWGPIPDIYGNPVYSTDFAGKVVVLNFWATWCPPCVAEIPDLVALYQKYSPDGLVVVGVSLDTSSDGINAPSWLVGSFAASKGMYYPVLTDRPSWWAIESAFGGIIGIPTTFVIDRQNQIWTKYVGSQSFTTFEAGVLPLLYPNLTVNLNFAGGFTHVSWPVTQATFLLESSSTLISSSWTPVATPIQSDGVNQFVDLPMSTGRQFFRLHHQ